VKRLEMLLECLKLICVLLRSLQRLFVGEVEVEVGPVVVLGATANDVGVCHIEMRNHVEVQDE
jgi:hypothetical protein